MVPRFARAALSLPKSPPLGSCDREKRPVSQSAAVTLEEDQVSPSWCDPVGRASSCKLKCCGFDFRSEPMSEFRAWSLEGNR